MVSQEKKNTVIIGAGIVGVSAAVWLQREGHQVTLDDRLGPGEGTSYGNGGVLASCAIVPVTGPGLIWKAPGMLLDRDQPLFMKWRYLPKLVPWLIKYLRHNNEADTRRIAAALYGVIGDSLEDHQALASGTGAEKYVVPSDYVYVYRNRSEFEDEALSWDIRRGHGYQVARDWPRRTGSLCARPFRRDEIRYCASQTWPHQRSGCLCESPCAPCCLQGGHDQKRAMSRILLFAMVRLVALSWITRLWTVTR